MIACFRGKGLGQIHPGPLPLGNAKPNLYMATQGERFSFPIDGIMARILSIRSQLRSRNTYGYVLQKYDKFKYGADFNT